MMTAPRGGEWDGSPLMHEDYPATTELLGRFYDGDEDALDALLRLHLPWLRARIRARCGAEVLRKNESEDMVQEAMVRFLEYTPRFVVRTIAEFRALLLRIAENVIRDAHDYFHAARRDMARERPLPRSTVLYLAPLAMGVDTPSAVVSRDEQDAMVRMGLELLDPPDRDVIVLRDWHEHEFASIGKCLGISDEAARKRYTRACARVADKVVCLGRGDLRRALGNGETLDAGGAAELGI